MTTPIVHACAVAWDHINTKTLADATVAELAACRHHPAVQALEAQLAQVMRSGNLVVVQSCLQDLNKCYKAALQQVRQEGKR